MADKVEVDPEQLRSAAGSTTDVQTAIDTVISTLTAALAGRGAPWGNDSLGRRLASQYEPAKQALIDGAGTFSGTFQGLATGQIDAADQMERTDIISGDGFR
ncbi:hypothetical protein [Nocardia sp. BMG111209]|uniref:hypothetical protein n=1 Tax=Nocardia sp. BMG111209 TaxID=1160137 RepID=UPI0012DE40C8|nr:hypothetical protein [Nocardia sp. BMG111209]